MKCVLAGIFIALAVNAVTAENLYGRSLLQAQAGSAAEAESTEGASAVATGYAKSEGGTVTSYVSANSAAFVEVTNSISIVIVEAVAEVENGGDAVAVASGKAVAVTEVIAKAYAEVYAEVESTGDGEGCAYGFASAEAAAEAYAVAYVKAVAKASDETNQALAVSEASAIKAATVEAFADAEAAVCVYGEGYASAYQKSLAEAIFKAYAEAIAYSLAGVKSGKAAAVSGAQSTLEVETDSNASTVSDTYTEAGEDSTAVAGATGNAGAAVTEIELCIEHGLGGCCDKTRFGLRRVCYCGSGCRAYLYEEDGEYYYEKRDGFKCYC